MGGTGLCELLLDIDMVLNSEKGTQYQSETLTNYIKENILLKEKDLPIKINDSAYPYRII